MAVLNEWVFPQGKLARDGWESVVDQNLPGWQHTGIRVAELESSSPLELAAEQVERLVIPLAGAFRVEHEGNVTELSGRSGVFEGPTDVLYLSTGVAATLSGQGRVAVAEAPTDQVFPSRHITKDEVQVELRGAGRDSRQVHNFGTPAVLQAGSFIVCEVITPGGNWSSHPAHKHDEHVPGHESRLEEIYYFETAPVRGAVAPPEADAFGLFASYSSPAGEIDTNTIVRTGDIVLVPHGFHGPASAAPEYDLYYLNVMAGPDPERVWHISDDPAQAWVRDLWADASLDERLPYEQGEQAK